MTTEQLQSSVGEEHDNSHGAALLSRGWWAWACSQIFLRCIFFYVLFMRFAKHCIHLFEVVKPSSFHLFILSSVCQCKTKIMSLMLNEWRMTESHFSLNFKYLHHLQPAVTHFHPSLWLIPIIDQSVYSFIKLHTEALIKQWLLQ